MILVTISEATWTGILTDILNATGYLGASPRCDFKTLAWPSPVSWQTADMSKYAIKAEIFYRIIKPVKILIRYQSKSGILLTVYDNGRIGIENFGKEDIDYILND